MLSASHRTTANEGDPERNNGRRSMVPHCYKEWYLMLPGSHLQLERTGNSTEILT